MIFIGHQLKSENGVGVSSAMRHVVVENDQIRSDQIRSDQLRQPECRDVVLDFVHIVLCNTFVFRYPLFLSKKESGSELGEWVNRDSL